MAFSFFLSSNVPCKALLFSFVHKEMLPVAVNASLHSRLWVCAWAAEADAVCAWAAAAGAEAACA